MLRNALAVAWKELQVLFKDKGELAVLFLMPIMFGSVIGSAFGGGSPGIGIYLVNQDSGTYSKQVVETLREIEAFRIEELDTVGQADQRVADGDALAAIIIPPDFSEKIDAFEFTQIDVIVDPTQEQYGSIVTGIMNEVLTPAILQGEIKYGVRTVIDESGAFDKADPEVRRMVEAQTLGVIMTQLRELFENPQITVEAEDLEGVKSQSLSNAYEYTMPSYAVMFAFFIVGTIAASILSEREQGTSRRLVASPIHKTSIVAGKMLAYMLVVGLQVLVVLGVGRVFFNVSLGESPLGLLLLTGGLALAATSVGMLVATLARTRNQAGQVGMVLGIVLAAIGGGVVPIPDSGFLHVLSQLTPHSHAIAGYMKLIAEEAGVVEILPQAGLLVGVGILFSAIAILRLKFE